MSSEMNEMHRPESWDFGDERETPAERPRRARAVVSVAFQRDEFDSVVRFAEKSGRPVSAVIREATLEHVSSAGASGQLKLVSAGGTATMTAYFDGLPGSNVAGGSYDVTGYRITTPPAASSDDRRKAQ